MVHFKFILEFGLIEKLLWNQFENICLLVSELNYRESSLLTNSSKKIHFV